MRKLKVEKFAPCCWKRCLAESQATFLDQTVEGVLSYATFGQGHPALTCWLMMYLKAQTMCLSYGNINPADLLLNDRVWIIYIRFNENTMIRLKSVV